MIMDTYTFQSERTSRHLPSVDFISSKKCTSHYYQPHPLALLRIDYILYLDNKLRPVFEQQINQTAPHNHAFLPACDSG